MSASRQKPSGFTNDGRSITPADLAEKIASYPRVRLCQDVDGRPSGHDWIVHERDRYLITAALRRLKMEDLPAGFTDDAGETR